MKLSSYTPQVNLGRQQANIDTRPLAAAYGADQSGTKALAAGLKQATDTIDKIEEQRMVAKVTDANTEYNKRMSQIYNDLANTQLDGADGASTIYAQMEKETRAAVMKDKGLNIQRAVDAFNSMADKDSIGRVSALQRHEYTEGEKYKEVVLTDAVNQISQQTRDAYNNPEALENAVAKVSILSDANSTGKGEKYAELYRNNNISSLVNGWVGSALANNDTSAIANLMNKYGKYVSTDKYNSVMNVLNTKQKNTYYSTTAKELYAKYGNNPQAALEAIQNITGYSSPSSKVENGPNTQLNLADHVTLNSDSTDLSTLSKPFSSGMAAMAAAFEKAFPGRELNITCGTEGEHVPNSDHYAGNAADIASDSMDADEAERIWVKENAGKYGLSVYDEYENDSPKKTGDHLHVSLDDEDTALGISKDTPAQSEKVITLTSEDKDAIFKAYQQEVSKAQWIENQNKKALTEQYVNQYAGSNMTASEIFNEASQGVTDMNTLQAIKSAASICGVAATRGGNGAAGSSRSLLDADVANIAEDMKAGKVKNLDTLITAAQNAGVTKESDLNKLRKLWDNYIDGKGYFSKSDEINASIDSITANLPTGEKAKAKKELKAYAYSFIQSYQLEHNGESPNELELRQGLMEARVQKPVGTYYDSNPWFGKSFDTSVAKLYAKGYIGYYSKENDPNQELGENEYLLIRKDGSTLYVTGQQFDELINSVDDDEEK